MKTSAHLFVPGFRSESSARKRFFKEEGNVLLMVLFVGGLLLPIVMSLVYASQLQFRTVSVSQSWQNAIPITEAGIEEGMTHINTDCMTNGSGLWTKNGWEMYSTPTVKYYAPPRRTLPDGSYYDVRVVTKGTKGESEDAPDVVCVGAVKALIGAKAYDATSSNLDRRTNSYIRRQIRLTASHSGWPDLGLGGVSDLDLAGTARSFDSEGSSSYWGHYRPDLAQANTIVGSINGDVTVGNGMDVYGKVETSPGGTTNLSGSASVGDKAWVDGGTNGVQDGHYSNNLDVDEPTVTIPDGAASWTLLTTSSGGWATYTREYVTNGAWVVSTNNPISAGIPIPGNLVLTNTNDVWYSTNYYASGTYPGPPVQTFYATNTVAGRTNVPASGTILFSNIVTAYWVTNISSSQTVPATSPTAGSYLTTPILSAPTGYSYVESSGIWVFLKGTNYQSAKCDTNWPNGMVQFWYNTITNLGSTGGQCTTISGNQRATNYNYAWIREKRWQMGGTTNWTYYSPSNYMYVMTTYSYYGPRTNDLDVKYNYTYIANGGDYRMTDLSMSGQQRFLARGGANRLYISGTVKLSGQAQIVIAPGSSLTIYVAGDTADFSGNGILNEDDKCWNFQLYGATTCTDVKIAGNARFTGLLCVPSAQLTFNGGGNAGLFIGLAMADTVKVNGSHGMNFVYDEAVKRHIAIQYRRASWIEEVAGAND